MKEDEKYESLKAKLRKLAALAEREPERQYILQTD